MQGKRSNLPGLLGKKLTMVCWRDATPLFILSLFFLLPVFLLSVFLFFFCLSRLSYSFCFSLGLSLSLFLLSFALFPVLLVLFLLFGVVLCSSLLSLYFARVSMFFLLECTVSGAVTAEDGALELLLKTKCNGLTLCFSLLFVSPLSLCVSLCSFFFFSLYWFSRPCSLWFFFYLPPSFVHGPSLAFINPENAMRSPPYNKATDRC